MDTDEALEALSRTTGKPVEELRINMIDLLQERGWSREQAYVICSVAVDLKVSNIVDLPNVTVSAFLPEDIFHG